MFLFITHQELQGKIADSNKQFDFTEVIECDDKEIEMDFEHENEILTIIAKVDKRMAYSVTPSTYLKPKEVNISKNDIDVHSVEIYGEEGKFDIDIVQEELIKSELSKKVIS